MSGPSDPFKRFAQQIQRTTAGGGSPGGRGALAGGGLLIALALGGVALNASLFNGVYYLLLLYRARLVEEHYASTTSSVHPLGGFSMS
jgi:hypothetical protein